MLSVLTLETECNVCTMCRVLPPIPWNTSKQTYWFIASSVITLLYRVSIILLDKLTGGAAQLHIMGMFDSLTWDHVSIGRTPIYTCLERDIQLSTVKYTTEITIAVLWISTLFLFCFKNSAAYEPLDMYHNTVCCHMYIHTCTSPTRCGLV